MPNLNKVIIEGHIGKAPDLTKKPYRVSIATSTGFKEKAKTTWHVVTVWESTPLQGADKGDEAYVIGHIENSERDGKYYTNIIADAIMVKKKRMREETVGFTPEENDIGGL